MSTNNIYVIGIVHSKDIGIQRMYFMWKYHYLHPVITTTTPLTIWQPCIHFQLINGESCRRKLVSSWALLFDLLDTRAEGVRYHLGDIYDSFTHSHYKSIDRCCVTYPYKNQSLHFQNIFKYPCSITLLMNSLSRAQEKGWCGREKSWWNYIVDWLISATLEDAG